MKKIYIILIILCLMSAFVSCSILPDDVDKTDKNDNYSDNADSSGPRFQNIEDFKEFVYGVDDYTGKPRTEYKKCYVEFDSIIPNEEIDRIYTGIEYETDNGDIGAGVAIYSLRYKTEDELEEGLKIGVGYGDFFTKYYITPYKESILSNGEAYKTFDDLPENNNESFIMNIDGECLLYVYFENKPWSIQFMIDEHYFYINSFNSASSAQDKFISAFLPELGATDESATTMLNRIKALIPTGDEANGAQANASASADASFELDSTNPIDTPSSDDSGNSEQTAGETVADTDVTDTPVNEEEEEYLYPEDYEFPVIPGISPDWKPNRNGKYPLKEAYTRD